MTFQKAGFPTVFELTKRTANRPSTPNKTFFTLFGKVGDFATACGELMQHNVQMPCFDDFSFGEMVQDRQKTFFYVSPLRGVNKLGKRDRLSPLN